MEFNGYIMPMYLAVSDKSVFFIYVCLDVRCGSTALIPFVLALGENIVSDKLFKKLAVGQCKVLHSLWNWGLIRIIL